jgi:cell division protein FtsB
VCAVLALAFWTQKYAENNARIDPGHRFGFVLIGKGLSTPSVRKCNGLLAIFVVIPLAIAVLHVALLNCIFEENSSFRAFTIALFLVEMSLAGVIFLMFLLQWGWNCPHTHKDLAAVTDTVTALQKQAAKDKDEDTARQLKEVSEGLRAAATREDWQAIMRMLQQIHATNTGTDARVKELKDELDAFIVVQLAPTSLN